MQGASGKYYWRELPFADLKIKCANPAERKSRLVMVRFLLYPLFFTKIDLIFTNSFFVNGRRVVPTKAPFTSGISTTAEALAVLGMSKSRLSGEILFVKLASGFR
jgi:hypothetical protein